MPNDKIKLSTILPAPLAGYIMVMDEAMSKHHVISTEARAWAHIRQELIKTHAKVETQNE